MPVLVLATRNKHKTREFAQILGQEFSVSDLSDFSDHAPVEENGATFEANAIIKAIAASRVTSELVVADDSGLVVAALHGEPGVRSARYAGENASDQENVAKLLMELEARGVTNREAQFSLHTGTGPSGRSAGHVCRENRWRDCRGAARKKRIRLRSGLRAERIRSHLCRTR